MFLRTISTPLTDLKGVGPATAGAFAAMGIRTVADLLLHAPRSYEDRSTVVTLTEGIEGRPVNTEAVVIARDWFGFGRKKTLKVWVEDSSGRGTLNCFGRNFLEQKLPEGMRIHLYGHFSFRFGEIQASSFDFTPILQDKPPDDFAGFLPVYPATADLSQKAIRNALLHALERFADSIEDELPPSCLEGRTQNKAGLLKSLHFPASWKEADHARRELAREELFYLQMSIARRGLEQRRESRTRSPGKETLASRVTASLPFSLTPDQESVLAEIRREMASPRSIARLIQGDVGSGKTLVAFLAACETVEAGEQAAFMAPTELLARQHAENAARMLEPAGIRLGLFTGSVTGEARSLLLKQLKAGEIDLLIGTHALFSEHVEFRRLGLVIIDEQQRFGVLQRLALTKKGDQPDLLVMTATPIPRTLALTVFGDLDVSRIYTMPPGRKPVITHLAMMGKEEKVYRWLEKEVTAGRQAYCVYPLIQESSRIDLKDAEGMFELLRQRFPGFSVGLIHSRLQEEHKLETMHRFAAGDIDILVATSVVEVGVDVPNATCMVVEHAERFGLAALHQLRGRVGRGGHQSYMFLVYSGDLAEEGKKRLKVMKECSDGFEVAEEDLKIRGPGNISGIEQAGFLRLRFADLVQDTDLMLEARESARKILNNDPGLLLPDNTLIRRVLQRTRPYDDENEENK